MLKNIFFLFIPFLLLPNSVFSLGLGDITVYSSLNEPLKVHIELVNSKSTPLDEITVKNASLNTYRRANLPKPDVFNKVRFKTSKKADDSLVVELTSKRPIREPFITFIADMSWRNGHINREYTFLLDPPEFVQQHSRSKPMQKKAVLKSKKPTTSVKTSTFNKIRKVKPSNTDFSAVIAAHDNEVNTYGPTRPADTLWDIAKRVKPDNQVSTYQTMQALFVLNPDAFINGNINLLKQGQTLSIPTSNEILQINGKKPLPKLPDRKKKSLASSKTLSKQKQSRQVIEQPSDDKETLKPESSKQTAYQDEARLKIIPPNEELLIKPVTSKNDLLIINKALKTSIKTIKLLQTENETLALQVNRLSEKLNSLDSHNQELNDKIAEITTLLKNQQNSTVQNEENLPLKETQLQASVDTQGTVEKNTTTSLSIDSQLAQAEGKPRSFVRELLTNPMITFLLAIFTIIILVAALISIRKQKDKRKQNAYKSFPENQDVKSVTTTDSFLNQDQSAKASVSKSVSDQKPDSVVETKEDDMDFFEYFEKKINAPDDNPIESTSAESEAVTEPEDSAAFNFDLNISDKEIQEYEKSITQSYDLSKKKTTIDNILNEIDTYIAYGNYAKAEKLLTEKIQKTPSDKNLHMKLFECYTLENKRYEFIKHVERVVQLLNIDIALRHRVENIYQQTWNETLNINKFT